MKKSLTALLLLVCMMAAMLASCTGTTPDVAATEDIITDLADVNWTLPVEGASATSYTMAEAQNHDLSKFIVSMMRSSNDANISFSRISMIMEGCLLKEMVADLGMESASGATVEVVSLTDGDISFELTAEDLASDYCLIGWICNKKEPLPDTETYVGIFFNDDYKGEGQSSCWLKKIIFH